MLRDKIVFFFFFLVNKYLLSTLSMTGTKVGSGNERLDERYRDRV